MIPDIVEENSHNLRFDRDRVGCVIPHWWLMNHLFVTVVTSLHLTGCLTSQHKCFTYINISHCTNIPLIFSVWRKKTMSRKSRFRNSTDLQNLPLPSWTWSRNQRALDFQTEQRLQLKRYNVHEVSSWLYLHLTLHLFSSFSTIISCPHISSLHRHTGNIRVSTFKRDALFWHLYIDLCKTEICTKVKLHTNRLLTFDSSLSTFSARGQNTRPPYCTYV